MLRPSRKFAGSANRYSKTFGRHHVAAVAGFSYQNFLYDGESIENKGFPTEGMKYYQIGNGDAEKTYLKASSYRNSNTLAAAFARVNYNYSEKYLVSASIRRELATDFLGRLRLVIPLLLQYLLASFRSHSRVANVQ